MPKTKPKPCPFCGGEPVFITNTSHIYGGGGKYKGRNENWTNAYAKCEGCRVKIGPFEGSTTVAVALAEKAWNTRIAESAKGGVK